MNVECMENSEIPEGKKRDKNEKIELPFEHHQRDWGSWVYDHRAGIMVTVIAYLILGIAIVTARIIIKPKEAQTTFYVDLQQLEDLIQEKERLEEQIREAEMLQQMERDYYESVRNMASNEAGRLDAGLRDDRGTQASEIYEEAQAAQERLRASREAYERGVQEADNILNNRPQSRPGDSENRESVKVAGKVTVSYYLPGRQATYLPVPAYQCQGGGEITIDIVVNRNGQVTSASVSAVSSNDPCLREFALKAAQSSTFNVDGTADNRAQGTITYLFVPQ